MTTDTDGIVWRPTPEVIERSRIGRFMRAHGIATLDDLQRICDAIGLEHRSGQLPGATAPAGDEPQVVQEDRTTTPASV